MSLQDRDDEDTTIYKVVINDEEQYSIWHEQRENPAGWNDAGKIGLKTECLAYIREAWSDMRPLSLRKRMEELALHPPALAAPSLSPSGKGESLVDRLCGGEHPFVLSLRPEPTIKRLKEAIAQGYLCVKFTNTEPDTELGMQLDKDACDFDNANFDEGIGSARAVGELTLDYVQVRCVADIDLATLAGRGHLEKVEVVSGQA